MDKELFDDGKSNTMVHQFMKNGVSDPQLGGSLFEGFLMGFTLVITSNLFSLV